MLRVVFTLLFVFGLTAHADSPEVTDTGNIVRLMSRFGSAHACPISPNFALTNAHVIDMKPFENVPLYGGRFETLKGDVSGYAEAAIVSVKEDLGLVMLSPQVNGFYPIATEAPKKGETLHWVSYDWRKEKAAFAVRPLSGEVLTIVTGNVVLKAQTPQGASGSCVLNQKSEVVGIVAWGMGVGEYDEVTVAVGVWGPWRSSVDSLRASIESALDKSVKEAVQSTP